MNRKRPDLVVIAIAVLAMACDGPEQEEARQRAREEAAWSGPCADTSWLLATTAGSPDRATCTNKSHRMRVQVASSASNEEFGAVVFCECERPDAGGSP